MARLRPLALDLVEKTLVEERARTAAVAPDGARVKVGHAPQTKTAGGVEPVATAHRP